MIAVLGVGLFAVGLFLVVKSGLIKSWFILKTLPGLLSARMIYALFPMGVGFLLLALGPLLPMKQQIRDAWVILFFFCEFLGFAFMIWPPRWIYPKWLQWLEREYGYCLDILIEEAQKMNRWDWEARVRTQAGMQAWIDEVMARRQEEIDRLWLELRSYLLMRQADADGRIGPAPGEPLKSYIPEHRRTEEEARRREEIEISKRRQAKTKGKGKQGQS